LLLFFATTGFRVFYINNLFSGGFEMKKYLIVVLPFLFCLSLVSCAYYPYPPEGYNTQVGSVVGGGMGALLGQAIGNNTESTIAGLAAGTIIGALVGNAADQANQAAAARDAAQYGKPTVFYDENGRAVEAIPEPGSAPNCTRVRKRVWENGKLVEEKVEEICHSSKKPVVQPPPPPILYFNGWWGWPYGPPRYFYLRPYYRLKPRVYVPHPYR